MELINILEKNNFKCSVSSVLNKDVKQHGKHFMFDGEEDTAWNSNEGTPQLIVIQFEKPQSVSEFSFQFQGGFVGKSAKVQIECLDGNILYDEPFYPEDVNSIQNFKLKTPIADSLVIKIKFIFGGSTDFFGRIIVYKLKLFGKINNCRE